MHPTVMSYYRYRATGDHVPECLWRPGNVLGCGVYGEQAPILRLVQASQHALCDGIRKRVESEIS
jgi:hypothetical protein